MLDCRFVQQGAADTRLLALVDSGASFNFMSSSVARGLGWTVSSSSGSIGVKLANGTVVQSLGTTCGLVSSSVW